MRQTGNWLFATGREGMRVFDRSSQQERLFTSTWQSAITPLTPTGGATVDAEARAAISEVILALRVSGIIPAV